MNTNVANRVTKRPARQAMRRPCRRGGLVVHELDGEALMFNPTSSDTHRLNETAWFIWRRCDGLHGSQCIAEELAKAYDISTDGALEHVARLIDEFDSHGLLSDEAPAEEEAQPS